MKTRIPYTRPSVGPRERDLTLDAIQNGWGERCYDYIHRFEADFASHLGVRHALATSSATGALTLGLAALGLGPGDEVILADTNWVASVAPVVHLGATPVFVDVLQDSWCLDPDHVRHAVTPRTKAIIAVHLYGNLCEMDSLRLIADRFGLALIEDAAQAVGSAWRGASAGSMGRFGYFSFHGTKTITTGEGGMFVTNDSALFESVAVLANHGRRASEPRQFWPETVGFKFKMSNLQAALGCAQLERVEELVDRKRAILKYYRDRFAGFAEVTFNPEPLHVRHGAWMPTAVFTPESGVVREDLVRAFQHELIDARVFFWPLSSLPMFCPRPQNLNSWSLPSRAINLPSFHDITIEELERVCAVLLRCLECGRKRQS